MDLQDLWPPSQARIRATTQASSSILTRLRARRIRISHLGLLYGAAKRGSSWPVWRKRKGSNACHERHVKALFFLL